MHNNEYTMWHFDCQTWKIVFSINREMRRVFFYSPALSRGMRINSIFVHRTANKQPEGKKEKQKQHNKNG